MRKTIEIKNSKIAKNTLFNFFGQVIPLVIGFISIPFIIQGLGIERFGILSLAWVILGYFVVFDIGLSGALVKFVAENIGKGKKDKIISIVWTTVVLQFILGIIGTFVLCILSPIFVYKFLKLPPNLIQESIHTFYILALSLPIMMISNSFRGILEAQQRFDLVNLVKIPNMSLMFIIPLIGALFKLSLPMIVGLIVLARIGTLFTFLLVNLHMNPWLKKFSFNSKIPFKLFSFGGWVTVSNIVGPILVYLDRFLIGSIISIKAITYYSAPYELVTRFWIIPISLTSTLFPAFSSLQGMKKWDQIYNLTSRALKYIILIQGLIMFSIILFSKEILYFWLGAGFAKKSFLVLQILAFGVFINSLAHIPFSLLYGVGRPDLPAKFHLIELPIYVVAAWILIEKIGIVGASTVWTFRIIIDTILLFIAVFKIIKMPFNVYLANKTFLALIYILLFGLIGYSIKILIENLILPVQLLFWFILFVVFTLFIWTKTLDIKDKELILKVIKL